MKLFKHLSLLIFLSFLCYYPTTLSAQTKQELHVEVDTLNARFNRLYTTDYQKADSIINKALEIAVKSGYEKGEALSRMYLGVFHVHRGNNKEGIAQYFTALKIYEKDEKLNSLQCASLYYKLANAFAFEMDYKRSEEYCRKAIAIADKYQYDGIQGWAYTTLAEIYISTNKTDSVLYYLKAAEVIFTKRQNWTLLASIQNNYVAYYYNKGNFNKALDHELRALEMAKKGDEYTLDLYYLNAGEILRLLGRPQQAIYYLDSAHQHANLHKHDDLSIKIYIEKAKSYAKLNQLDSSIYYYEQTLSLKDSIYNDTYKKELAKVQTELDLYKHETENQLLLKDKRIAVQYRNLAIAGIILMIVLLAFILARQRLRIQRRIKNRLEEEVALRTKEIFHQKETIFHTNLQLKLALNGAKFDSHFVFNVLNAIQHVVLQQKPFEAQDYLAKLSRLMRYVLEKSPLNRVPLSEEVEMIERYIQLEQLRLDHHFEYSIEIDTAAKETTIPALLLQPYVENAILHGLAPATGPNLHLKLQIEVSNDLLTIQIWDNGIGRKKAKRQDHHSLGNKIGQERLDILTHLTHKNHLVFIEDLENADGSSAGTRVRLQLPIVVLPSAYEADTVVESAPLKLNVAYPC